jgi:hypothetical protein
VYNITYLIGAGASCKALPMVAQMSLRIQGLLKKLTEKDNQLEDDKEFEDLSLEIFKSRRDFQNEMIEMLVWLLESTKKHSSVDTFAKKLWLRNKTEDLKNLKIAIAVFFVLEQASTNPDSRYDSFFASIISDLRQLPDNIKILSWNYDNQLELSFSEYSGEVALGTNQEWLKTYSDVNYKKTKKGFAVFKLNGSAGLRGDFSRQLSFHNDLSVFDKKLINNVTKNFAVAITKDIHPSINFAWEHGLEPDGFVNTVINSVRETHVLVVIGYSFPFFNRDVDRRLIQSMAALRKIYFQAPDADNLKERFQAIRDGFNENNLVTRFDTEQFLLPNEL